MSIKFIEIQTKNITDWAGFHSAFVDSMGFPNFYGYNMDAWIDCMSYLDDPSAGMTQITISQGDIFHLIITDTENFRQRLPEIFTALIESIAFINQRRFNQRNHPIISLIFK